MISVSCFEQQYLTIRSRRTEQARAKSRDEYSFVGSRVSTLLYSFLEQPTHYLLELNDAVNHNLELNQS